jgi:hypothetical protein
MRAVCLAAFISLAHKQAEHLGTVRARLSKDVDPGMNQNGDPPG